MKIKTIVGRWSESDKIDREVESFINAIKDEHELVDLKVSTSERIMIVQVIYSERDVVRPRKSFKAKAGKGKVDGGEAQVN